MTEKELLLTSLLDCKRSDLYAKNFSLDDNQKEILTSMLKRREKGEPVQYITGFTEFMGFPIKVDRRVLIPRPETEILVEQTIQFIRNNFSAREINILDLCTGSGNIAISLARHLSGNRIVASDISSQALDIARENAAANNVQDKIIFIESDLFKQGFEGRNSLFDIIVCNPPYLKFSDLDHAATELAFEPRIALDAGKDGLLFYEKIISQAPQYLKKDGYLILEIGFNQLNAIKEILGFCKKFVLENVVKDYNNIDRVIFLRKVN